jgi:hypothetical protein
MKKCRKCNKTIDKKEVERIHGKESNVATLNFCSAMCYTKFYHSESFNSQFNDPTGHGDICYSDADPGL